MGCVALSKVCFCRTHPYTVHHRKIPRVELVQRSDALARQREVSTIPAQYSVIRYPIIKYLQAHLKLYAYYTGGCYDDPGCSSSYNGVRSLVARPDLCNLKQVHATACVQRALLASLHSQPRGYRPDDRRMVAIPVPNACPLANHLPSHRGSDFSVVLTRL